MTPILPHIRGPEDVKALRPDECAALAREMRELIVDAVCRNGGHFAPNLGVVELTIALHRVFSSPRDKILWDVGHQSYPHKLLTGRASRIHTVRQHGGLSGFCKRSESPHDILEAGHASTSISAALGLAKARDLRGEDFHVVAVIGDGAMTAGMAYEAMNNAGHQKTNLIVVLNDNSMSIAPNVGAISSYLNKIRSHPAYNRWKHEAGRVLKRIPWAGESLAGWADKMKDSLKYLLVPGILFEELGFTYLGPVDGHQIEAVENALRQAIRTSGPVLVHVLTQKGKGYRPAEADPDAWHGPGPFDPETGQFIKKPGPPTYSKVFGQTLVELAAADERIVGITAAMPSGTGLDLFAKAFPDRYFDVGIAEQHAVTFAAGLAMGGLVPVAAIYSTFLQRAYDQVIHDVCLMNLPVVFCLDRAGLVGGDGATHQGVYDLTYLRCLPGMVVMAPKDEDELRRMLKTAVEHAGAGRGPIALRYPRGSGRGVALTPVEAVEPLEIGRAEVLREGEDVALLAVGPMAYFALEAAAALELEGIEATVVNARFVRPLDGDLVEAVARRCGRLVCVEEHVVRGGFGSAVLEELSARGLRGIRTRLLGLPSAVIDHGDPKLFYREFGLTPPQIAEAARQLVRPRVVRAVGHRQVAGGATAGSDGASQS